MPVQGLATVTAPASKDWTPVAENVYQVVITDISERDGKKYQSDEDIIQYFFKFAILDEGEFKEQQVTAFSSTSWFGGSKKGMSPSKLVNIFKAIYGFYLPGINVSEMQAEEVTRLMNENVLIGAQVKIIVKLSDDKQNNKVTDFMSIAAELPVPETIKLEGEFKLKKEGQVTPSSEASSANPATPEDFIKGLEDDRKVDDMTTDEVAKAIG